MDSIVVTGATSMIGVALINEAIKENINVLAIVRKNSSKLHRIPNSKLIKIIYCELDELYKLEVDGKYDVFYHFAWSHTDRQGRFDPVMQEKNIKYTLDAVNLANKLSSKKFIGAGSQAEYGKIEGVISYDTPVNPSLCYGMAKYASGKLSCELCKKLGIIHIWPRVFSVYGKNDGSQTMISYAFKQFLENKVAEFSAGTQMWDYLNEKDAGIIFLKIGQLINEDKGYCIASGHSKMIKEYIMEMAEVLGDEFKYSFAKVNSKDVFGLQVDISGIKEDINFVPQVDFKEGILDILKSVNLS